MNLVVYSNHSLEELETIVTSHFSEIKNKEVQVPSFFDPKPYDETNLGFLYKVEPVMQENKLTLMIPIAYTEKLIETRPANYLSHCLGHEGEGSLLSCLMRDELATALSSYHDTMLNSFTYLIVNIYLTENGLSKYQEVIEKSLAYFKMLKENGPSEDAFDEAAKAG